MTAYDSYQKAMTMKELRKQINIYVRKTQKCQQIVANKDQMTSNEKDITENFGTEE